ncbi:MULTISPECIES: epoxide hydrolase family protein [Protofrankia]|uniref:epoxide hydrolase family protein n=1 Tax=Protofrankia TaxID=2994361 RepID=UPI0009FA6471|nr:MULTISPECIES: epoxide hydrolase family protein [Protofrankia]
MDDTITPFQLAIDEAELDDLRDRLRRTRWPRAETVNDWSQGVPLSYIQELCAYWADDYTWRNCEHRLNAVGQFRTPIDGLDIHFLHARSPHPDALPLIMTHGWPGSVREFLDVIEPLVRPEDPADAFHVVCPSLPGFGFSGHPTRTGWNVQRVADAWTTLMARLGYTRYGAHGGDWGSVVTARIGATDPAHVAGVHLTIPVVDLAAEPDPDVVLSAFEQAGADRAAAFARTGMGYLTQQATRPQTLGYGLADSPAGQLAWIVEKFYAWTDCKGHPENAISREAMLDDVMLYWLPDTGATAARIYWESFPDMPDDTVRVPTGCSIFPLEHVRVPRARAEARLTDIRYWNELSVGGHFPALEQPATFVDELRTFFRLVRKE